MVHRSLIGLSIGRVLLSCVLFTSVVPRVEAAPPPPPAETPAATPAAPSTPDSIVLQPPSPDGYSRDVETARARQAMTEALDKYSRYWGPRYSIAVTQVKLEGEWALGLTEWGEEAETDLLPLQVLANRLPNGQWQALLPGGNNAYIQWIERIPENLLSIAERESLRVQAEALDVLFKDKSWPATVRDLPLPSYTLVPTVAISEGIKTDQGEPVRGEVNKFEVGSPAEQSTPTPVIPTRATRLPPALPKTTEEPLSSPTASPPPMPTSPTPTPTQRALPDLDALRRLSWPSATPEPFLQVKTQPTTKYQRPATWVAGETSMSRLTNEERRKYLGISLEMMELERQRAEQQPQTPARTYSYPTAVDWRSYNHQDWTTPIRSQEGCGACVAFGVIGAIEARLEIANNNSNLNPDLSEAHLFFCNGATCAGWWPEPALNAARDIGIVDEDCYPYVPEDQICSACAGWETQVTKIDGWTTTTNIDEIKQALADSGPVEAGLVVYADFFHYTSGVYRHVWGDVVGGHSVSLVGYDDVGRYWIAKNSWGPYWGENGWFRIAYGEAGIDHHANIPTVFGNFDVVDPDGAITSPAEGVTVTSAALRLDGWGSDNVSGFDHAHFTAEYGGSWRQIGPDFTTSPFGFDWDFCAAGVSNGPVTIGLDIWDRTGNEANSPRGVRHITKSFNCEPTPQCNPGNNQVGLYSSTDYGGTCKVLNVGDFGNPTDLNPIGNDNTRSIKVGSQVQAILYWDAGFNGLAETFTNNDPNLLGNSIQSQTSSVRVQWRPSSSCNPTADQVALYETAGYGGRCITLSTGDYPTPGYLGEVGNDNTESIRVGGNVKAWLHEEENYNGRNELFQVDDIDLGNNAIGANSVSSVKVQPRGQALLAPTLAGPANNSSIGEGTSITLSYISAGAGVEYYGEIWGGPGGTLTFEWTSSTSYSIGTQWAGYQYSWHVKARNSAGESGWSETRTFQVRPAMPTDLAATAVSCSRIDLTWHDNSGSEEGYRIYRNGAYVDQIGMNSSTYQDSGLVGDQGYDYYVVAFRGSIASAQSYTAHANTPSCPPADTQPPSLHWVAPVGNQQTYSCASGFADLEVSASDNVGVSRVHFYRWDAVTAQSVDIGNDYSTPYQSSLSCSGLNAGSNSIFANAYDSAGNDSGSKYIWINREPPGPDLHPYTPAGHSYPVVPSSVQGTHEVNTLYAGVPTYFDISFTNDGTQATHGIFYYELWVDSIRVAYYLDADYYLNRWAGLFDLSHIVATPGWHTVGLSVDVDNTINESDESNNTWEHQFYWESSGDAYEPDNLWDQAKTLTGSQTHSIKPATDVDWMKFTVSESSEVIIETSGVSGDTRMWLYDGNLTELEYDNDAGPNLFSRIDRLCSADPLPVGTYYIKVDEYGNNNEIASYDIALTSRTCTSIDTQPPIVSWLAPVQNEGVHHCRDESIQLEVDATDNVTVSRVHFSRWDAVNNRTVDLGDDYDVPYQMSTNCDSLNLEWNQIDAFAFDTAGNTSTSKWIWLYHDQPAPDLRPYRMIGYDDPVVLSSEQGTNTVGTLYAGQTTYVDWYWVNGGDAMATGSFYIELWIDNVRHIRYPYSNWNARQIGGFDDWGLTVDTPGWHTVRLVADPNGTVGEYDETNNTWQKDFYWTSPGDSYEPDDTSSQANLFYGPQTHSIVPAADIDWLALWVGDDSQVVIETSGASGDTRMWLYDTNLTELEYDDDTGVNLFSRIDRVCGVDPLPAGVYYVKIDEYGNNDEIASYDITLSAPSCASLDNEPPVVNWAAPVPEQGIYHCFSEPVGLEASASDNQAVAHVDFDRWDAPNNQFVLINTDDTAPYQASVDCDALNYEWNQIDATAYDTVGNASPFKWIWVYRDRPAPDLVPAHWPGWQYPIVPASHPGTSSVDTLHAGFPTYIDWGLANIGNVESAGDAFADLYVDSTRVAHYPFGNVPAGESWALIDWAETVSTPGWHTLRVVTDPDQLIVESDEGNNAWEHDFYWTASAPFHDDFEGEAGDWSASGLWHLSDRNSNSGAHSWWYGQDANSSYETGAANAGDLTTPLVYLPGAGYYLRFRYRYETETHGADWDQRWVQISVDNGPFENVLQLSDDPMNFWLDSPVIDLSPYAGHTIQVRFRFDTLDALLNGFGGWFIDDLDISTTPPPSCTAAHEPNNSPTEATNFAYSGNIQEEICPGGDQDYYRFSGLTGDRIAVDIDAQTLGSQLDSYLTLYDSDGITILAENDDELPGVVDSHMGYQLPHDGTYYLKVRAWNHPSVGGNQFHYILRLMLDNSVPSLATINSPLDGAWLNPDLQSVDASAGDSESGINRVEFWWHSADWGADDWIWLGADNDERDGWHWDFDTSSLNEQKGAAFYIFAFDWAGNWTGDGNWDLGLDRTAPVVSMSTSSMYGNAPFRDFHVTWSGTDNLSGISTYDVQIRDGVAGSWDNLVIGTIDTYFRFIGENGHTYYFRARAQDIAGTQGSYVGGDGDAQYLVQTCPVSADAYEPDDTAASARVLLADGSAQIHNFHAEEDQDWIKFSASPGITYTLTTGNTGGHADTVIFLYDVDASTLLGYNDDDYLNWPASRLQWQAPVDGVYHVMVKHYDPYAFGCTTEYQISIDPGAFPEAIEDLAISVEGTGVSLSWSPVTQNDNGEPVVIDHYNVYRSNEAFFTPTGATPIGTSTSTTFIDPDVMTTTDHYYYLVTAIDTSGRESESSNRVGKFSRPIASGWSMVSWPLLPASGSLDATLGTQLRGTDSPETADRVLVWNPATQSYDAAWFCGGPVCESWGEPYYNHWLANDYSLSPLTLPPDAGFWIQNRSGAAEILVILGEVAESDRSVQVGQGWQLLGSAFPVDKPLESANLPATGTDSPETADRVLHWDDATQTYKSAWYCGGPVCETWGEPYANHWLANDYSPTDIVIQQGDGFWYQNRHAAFTWINGR